MKTSPAFEPRFVHFVPRDLEQGVVYISIEYATASHLCFCGCGERVVTPLAPTDWKLIFDGRTVSLYPSIGSWSLPCESHYWLRNNRVEWAPRWSRDEIEMGRAHRRLAHEWFFSDGPVEEEA